MGKCKILFLLAGMFGWMAAACHTARAIPIALSGFNADVVTEMGPAAQGRSFDGYGWDWPVSGLYDDTNSAVGFPTAGNFQSATGSGAQYFFQPYDANNALRMGNGDPYAGTLIVAPGRYSSLNILASSGTDGSLPYGDPYTSDITLNFADGSLTLVNALLGYDWNTLYSGAPQSAIALGGLDRNYLGTTLGYSSNVGLDTRRRYQFALYETNLDLTAAGVSNRILQSVTFNDVIPFNGATSVFAIDGVATTPEPASAAICLLAAVGLLRRRCR